jgi:hypothetical protein
MEGVLVVEVPSEIYPGEAAEEAGEVLFARLEGAREEDGDYPEGTVAHSHLQGRAHLLVLPGAETLGPQEHGAGAARVERLLQRLLPGVTRDKMPLVQERLDSRLPELPGELFHGRLVRVAVAQEDVVDRFHGGTVNFTEFSPRPEVILAVELPDPVLDLLISVPGLLISVAEWNGSGGEWSSAGCVWSSSGREIRGSGIEKRTKRT